MHKNQSGTQAEALANGTVAFFRVCHPHGLDRLRHFHFSGRRALSDDGKEAVTCETGSVREENDKSKLTAKSKTYPGHATPRYCQDRCHTYPIARVWHISWQCPGVADQEMPTVLQ